MASDTDDSRPLSEQLKEARDNVREQILRQMSTPSYGAATSDGPTGKEEVIQELEDELAQIESALANLPEGA
jgi:hypothetical protein